MMDERDRQLRIDALLARIVANARMVVDDEPKLNPDWVVIPREIVDLIEELLPRDEET